jgi:pilus assembly protein Flp/PilA
VGTVANRREAFIFLKFKHGDRKNHRCKEGVFVFDERRAPSLASERRLKFINLDLELVNMKTQIQTFISDESGASAIEYGLLAALIALAIVAGATTLGEKLGGLFSTIAGKLPSVPAAPVVP